MEHGPDKPEKADLPRRTVSRRSFLRAIAVSGTVGAALVACGAPATTGEAPAPTTAPAAAEPTSAPAAEATTAPAAEATSAPAAEATTAPATGAAPSGQVVVSLRNGIIVQDPSLTGSVSDIAHNRHSYDTLIESPAPGEFTPSLAESWENVDDLTWEFKLRQGVKFHNGETFNAEAVKVTLERWVDPEVKAPMGPILYPDGSIESVEIVDDYTVRVKSGKPFAPLLASLAITYMMPAEATKQAGTGPITENIGTGPFRVTEFVKQDHITMEAFADCWSGAPKIEKLIFRHMPEDATRMAALRAGEVDMLDEMSADQAKQLEGDGNFTVQQQLTVESLYPVFNVTTKPFDDVRVRKAMLLGIDRKAILEALLEQGQTLQRAPISPEVFPFNDALEQYPYDPEQAKALLAEAGYPDGFEVTFLVPGARYPKGRDLAQAYAAAANEIGVKINVDVPEMIAAFERTADLESWQIFQWGIAALTSDADFPLRWFWHSREDLDGRGATTFAKPEIDKLLDDGVAELDPTKRAELYKEAQKLLWDEAPAFWQYHVVDLFGINKRVTGFELRPDKRVNLRNISIVA